MYTYTACNSLLGNAQAYSLPHVSHSLTGRSTDIAEDAACLPSRLLHQVKYLEVPVVDGLHEGLLLLQQGVEHKVLLALGRGRSGQVRRHQLDYSTVFA